MSHATRILATEKEKKKKKKKEEEKISHMCESIGADCTLYNS